MRTRLLSLHHLLLVGILCMALGCHRGVDDANERDRLFSQIESRKKVVLAKMSISKMATIDDIQSWEAENIAERAQSLLNKLKIGSRKATFSYDTYMEAYIDLAKLSPSDITYDSKAKLIEVKLPEVETAFVGRDAEVKVEHYRVTGLRSQINAAERARLKELMNRSVRRDVESNPLYRARLESVARTKAVQFFTTLLSRDGWRVVVKVKN